MSCIDAPPQHTTAHMLCVPTPQGSPLEGPPISHVQPHPLPPHWPVCGWWDVSTRGGGTCVYGGVCVVHSGWGVLAMTNTSLVCCHMYKPSPPTYLYTHRHLIATAQHAQREHLHPPIPQHHCCMQGCMGAAHNMCNGLCRGHKPPQHFAVDCGQRSRLTRIRLTRRGCVPHPHTHKTHAVHGTHSHQVCGAPRHPQDPPEHCMAVVNALVNAPPWVKDMGCCWGWRMAGSKVEYWV